MTAESLDDLVARLRKRHSLSHDGSGFVDVYDDDDLAAANAIVALRARADKAGTLIATGTTQNPEYTPLGKRIVALEAEALALRTALRRAAIVTDSVWSSVSGNHARKACGECGSEWTNLNGEDNEWHRPNCLAEQIEKDKGG